MANDERLRELEEKYEDYSVYDSAGEKIGKVDDLFVDENDREEYIGVKMGLFGLSGTTLIPMEMVRANERERTIEVADSKDHVKDAPHYSDDDEVTHEFEDRIRRHFGLENIESSPARGSYGRYSGVATGATSTGETPTGETLRGDRMDAEPSGRPLGEGQDLGVYDEREREPLGREGYGNREDISSEPGRSNIGAGETTPSGDMRDLETGEPGRGAARTREDDVGNMTRGHRESPDRSELGDRGDLGSSGPGMARSDVGDEGAGGQSVDEGYHEGYREGYREGLREGLSEGDRGDLSSPGGVRGSGAPEEGMTRRGAGEPGAEGETERSGMPTERPVDETRGTERSSGEGGREASELTKVWRRIRR